VQPLTEDSEPACQRVLKAMINPDGFAAGHVFLNLYSMLVELREVHDVGTQLGRLPFVSLVTFMMQCHVAPAAYCCGHGAMCRLVRPDMDITGTPCQDFSPVGNHQGPFGRQWPVFLAYCRVMLELEVPILIHENVPQFWPELLEHFFGHAYLIFSMVMDCADVGFSLISRRRRYTIMYHKGHVHVTHNPHVVYDQLKVTMQSLHLSLRLSDCWLADMAEIMAEASQLCHLRGIPMHLAMQDMTSLLTAHEHQRLAAYMAMWQARFGHDAATDPTAVFNLADNPENGFVTWSASSGRIPGLRTNGGKLWVPCLGRWLTTKEQLAAMGVPVYPSLAAAAQVPLVPVSPGPEAKLMLGNMMHIASVGTALLVAMSCAQPSL